MAHAVGDIVRIAKQPPNLHVQVQGEVGYIEEIQGPYASVQTMRPDGTRGGCGGILLDCLEPEHEEVWKQAKAKLDAEVAKLLVEAEARRKRWDALVEKVAAEHNVTRAVALSIHRALGEFNA